MQAYLDNSATTRCSEGVRDIVVKVMMEDFGNPSSRHDKGMEAEKYLREARMEIAATLKADEKEIYFTSGGTESDNWTQGSYLPGSHRKTSEDLFFHSGLPVCN